MTLFTKKHSIQSLFISFDETMKRRVAAVPADQIRSKANGALILEHNLVQSMALPVLASKGVVPKSSKQSRDVTGDLRYHVMGGPKDANNRVMKEFNRFSFHIPVTGTIALLDYDEFHDMFGSSPNLL